MLKDFDVALTNKIRLWFSNTIYANSALVYNVAYNLVDDASLVLQFPLISIYRPDGFRLADNQSLSARRQGIEYADNHEDNKGFMARFLVAVLPYQLDIYAKSPEAMSDITEDIMQAINFDPTLTVTQKNRASNTNYTETYELTYNNGPVERSEFDNDDRIYHCSIVYELRNARIVNFRTTELIDDVQLNVDMEDDNNE